MTTPMEARTKLNTLADELGTMAGQLAEVERRLEPVENEYVQYIDNFDTGLWFNHINDGAKLPPADLRLKLARKQMDPDLLGRYVGLSNSRKRLVDRIRSLRAEIEAQRSILSALKEEMAGSR